MPKIGTNYDKGKFDLLFSQLADADLSAQEIRALAEEALHQIDMEYLEAIEGILIGKEGKTEDISAYFAVDTDFLAEEDKTLGERNAVNVISFLNKLAKGEYELIGHEKTAEETEEEKKEEKEDVAPQIPVEPSAIENKSEKKSAEEEKEMPKPADVGMVKILLSDRDMADTIGKRYDMPTFFGFAKETIVFSEETEQEDLARRFTNTFEKIPAVYYEFLEKAVIGVNGVREDPRNYIEMTDDAYQKFFSFAEKAPGEPLTPKEARKVMNILANLAQGTIKLKDGLAERGLAYHKERLPKIYESEAARREDALKAMRADFHQTKAIGEKGIERFLSAQMRVQKEVETEYEAIKKGTPRVGATEEQKQKREEAKQKMLREKAKYDFVKDKRKVYESENKKLRKAIDPQQTARITLENLRRKKELLGKDFSKKDEAQLKKAEKDFAEKTAKVRAVQKELLRDTVARMKKEGDPFPEHTVMRMNQIVTGNTPLMPLTAQQETALTYGIEQYKQRQEAAEREFMQGREASYAIENDVLRAASRKYREAYAAYRALKQQLEGKIPAAEEKEEAQKIDYDLLLNREIPDLSEHDVIEEASRTFREGYAKYTAQAEAPEADASEVEAPEEKVSEAEEKPSAAPKRKETQAPVSRADRARLKALARVALDAGKELKALREQAIRATIARAKELGDPFPEHTAMRCEQIRSGQLDFMPLATKAETLREAPRLSSKAKQVILRAETVSPDRERKSPEKPLPTPPVKEAGKDDEMQRSDVIETSEVLEKPAETPIKRTPVVFPEGSIPSTTKAPERVPVTPQKEMAPAIVKAEQEKKTEDLEAGL